MQHQLVLVNNYLTKKGIYVPLFFTAGKFGANITSGGNDNPTVTVSHNKVIGNIVCCN